MKTKVIKIDGGITFDNGYILYDDHDTDCCESHYLYYDDLTMKDFEGLEFDLSEESINNESFFKRIDDYGIELVPIHGWPVKIPGYASNNGYYSSNIDLILEKDRKEIKRYDISECQNWS